MPVPPVLSEYLVTVLRTDRSAAGITFSNCLHMVVRI